MVRARKSMDRLLTAYQEDLLSLDELRRRMPDLRQRGRRCGSNFRPCGIGKRMKLPCCG